MQARCERNHQEAFLFFSLLIHVLGIINFTLAIYLRMYYDMRNCRQDAFMKFAYSFKYGSLLNASIQWIHNLIALVVDLMIYLSYTKDAPYRLFYTRSFIRSTIAFPFGFYVCTRFWLFRYFRLQMVGADCYPSWLRHFLFTFNPLLLICDIISNRGDPPSSLAAFVTTNAVCTAYFVWLHIVYHFTGAWAMSFVKDASLVAKLVGYLFISMTAFMFFLIGQHLHSLLWNEGYVANIPVLRNFVSAPSPFVFGHPTQESLSFLKILSDTELLFIDSPKMKKTDITA